MNLKLLRDTYQIVRLKPGDKVPQNIFDQEFYSVTGTEHELSIVTSESMAMESENAEKGWKIIEIDGILDFSLTGIVSEISAILAHNDISIFVVSTYNTDYILVKEQILDKATAALADNGYCFL